ncbi:hypothetical protein A2U01_0116807, partial [Trifolium medium]|nr:hypothetical protein [Trifolium medium]
GLCGPVAEIDEGSGIVGGKLERSPRSGCKVGLVHLWTIDGCRSSVKQSQAVRGGEDMWAK